MVSEHKQLVLMPVNAASSIYTISLRGSRPFSLSNGCDRPGGNVLHSLCCMAACARHGDSFFVTRLFNLTEIQSSGGFVAEWPRETYLALGTLDCRLQKVSQDEEPLAL